MYWRKANAIHNWFVENVQDGNDDCGYYNFDGETLKELLVACKIELANRDKEDVEDEALTPTSGFFFGSTEKDEWYYKDLEKTVETLTKVLEDEEKYGIYPDYTYHSSW